MSAPCQNRQNAGWYRFRIGDFEGTAVWDGYIHHSYDGIYPNADPAEMLALKQAHRLPLDHIPMDLNPVVVNTGEKLLLIDAGMGQSVQWFGPGMGRLMQNLAAAGIAPQDIDAVLMTHLHPDHAYGLILADGSAAFPKAEVYCSDLDWAEWTNPESLKLDSFRAPWTQGVLAAIQPYAGRIRTFAAGDRLFPGVSTVSVAGHAAGMCAYRFESQGEKVIFTGDVAHHQVFDPSHPEWFFHMDYDTSPEQGAAAKSSIFAKVVAEKIRFHGYHFPFPGLGDVLPMEDGTYRFHAEAFSPRL